MARRRGSILILVVVMVVLLALMGTALLSGSRGDRYTSTQHTYNVQIDMLVEGVKELAKAKIGNSLTGTTNNTGTVTSSFRPPIDDNVAFSGTYGGYDAYKLTNLATDQGSDWLAPRAPTLTFTATTPPIPIAHWPAITSWMTGTTFESPAVCDAFGKYAPKLTPTFINTFASAASPLAPTYMKLGDEIYPAFTIGGNYYMAADADGDGIADSGFFRLPVGTLDGVTYFAAVRIVDSNSAINVNTAGSRMYDTLANGGTLCDAAGTPNTAPSIVDNLGWFKSHVGLQEMFNRSSTPTDQTTAFNENTWRTEAAGEGGAEMLSLNRYRLGYDYTATYGAGSINASGTISLDREYNPAPAAAGAFAGGAAAYLTTGDAIDHELAIRLRNPGLNILSTSGANTYTPTRAFDISNQTSLAYHNGAMINTDAGPSQLDTAFYSARGLYSPTSTFRDSIYSIAPNYRRSGPTGPPNNYKAGIKNAAYDANDVSHWYDDNYYADATAAQTNVNGLGTLSNLTDGSKYRSLRPFLTTSSPVSSLISQRTIPAIPTAAFTGVTPQSMPFTYNYTAAKASVNTSDFPELWRAFWNVMAEKTTGAGPTESTTPFGAGTYTSLTDIYEGMNFDASNTTTPLYGYQNVSNTPHPQRMFRSSIREFHLTNPMYFPPASEVLLRSAIAATNAMQMRSQATNTASNPVIKTVVLPAYDTSGTQSNLAVTIFGCRPQVFMTEVFINTDTVFAGPDGAGTPNPAGYIAVELYNPTNAPVSLANYEFCAVPKDASNSYPLTVTSIPIVGPATIPPQSYLVIDNLAASFGTGSTTGGGTVTTGSGTLSQNAATYVPPEVGNIAGARGYAALEMAYNDDLVLRERVVTGGTNPQDYRPIDSFDLNQINLAVASRGQVIHYARPVDALRSNWRCVYPGRYDVSGANYRHQGTDWGLFTPNASMDASPWVDGTTTPPAPAIPAGHAAITFGAANPTATWDPTGNTSTFTIQLPGTAGPDLVSGGNRVFPFGGFAREGDILQTPFIGAYVIQDATTGGLIDMTSISLDASFAEDSDINDDEVFTNSANPTDPREYGSHEQVGRFCPIHQHQVAANGDPFDLYRDDLEDNVGAGTYAYSAAVGVNTWNYRWARRLFDFVSVHSALLDYSPDAPTDSAFDATRHAVDNDNDKYQNGTFTMSGTPARNSYPEELEPTQGLININTAPARVLATLPMLHGGQDLSFNATTNADGTSSGTWTSSAHGTTAGASGGSLSANMTLPSFDNSLKLAEAIVLWRDGDAINGVLPHGPFRSIFDLYKVPAFAKAQDFLITNTTAMGGMGNPGIDAGDFTGVTGGGPDLARYDFEEQFILLNRISNLITTKSDGYTVYVLVEGWKNVGATTPPILVVKRRAAFVQDRWKLNSGDPATLNSPTNFPND